MTKSTENEPEITVPKVRFTITEQGQVVIRGKDLFGLVLTALIRSMDDDTREALLDDASDRETSLGAFDAMFTDQHELYPNEPVAVFTPSAPRASEIEKIKVAKNKRAPGGG